MCLTDERKFPFFSLPAEVRCMVYRAILTMTSTITRSTKEHLKNDEQPTQASQQLEQITNFNNLACSCKQIRSELFYEHVAYVLPLTQVHLGSAYRTPTPSALALTHNKILQQLQFSTFLTQHIYHLKTLEVVFTDPFYLPIQQLTSTSASGPVLSGSGPGVAEEAEEEAEEWNDSDNDSDEGYYEFAHFFCSFCWEDLMTLPPTLEKEATEWYQRRRVEEEQYERTGIWEKMEEEYKGGDESKFCYASEIDVYDQTESTLLSNSPAVPLSTRTRALYSIFLPKSGGNSFIDEHRITALHPTSGCLGKATAVHSVIGNAYLSLPSLNIEQHMSSLQTLPVNRGLTTVLESLALTCCKIRDEGSCDCARDRDVVQRGNHPGGLRWLLKLQQLTSLELVFTDARYNAMQRFTRSGFALPVPAEEDSDDEEDGGNDEFMDWFCLDCWELLMGLPHTLEKVVFKVWRGADENGEAAVPVVRETWEVMKWFRRMKVLEERYQRRLHLNVKDGVEDAVVVVEEEVDGVDEHQEPPTYHIEHHVGDVDVEWPLSGTI
ncbi:hypothetical protein NEUTE2DRAFT_65203 [Neurospora tetrasperma FGSC 2509]|nr:hypothetical protein NEUTE2DRAFT_65203 [Neurospora tetrasperma FGSC 2509]